MQNLILIQLPKHYVSIDEMILPLFDIEYCIPYLSTPKSNTDTPPYQTRTVNGFMV